MSGKTVTTDNVRSRLFEVMERASDGDIVPADARSVISAAKVMTETLIAERKQAEMSIKLGKKALDVGALVVAHK